MQKATNKQVWSTRLQAHAESGLNIQSWCAREGVTEATFYYWRKRLSTVSSLVTQLIALPLPARQTEPMLELQTPHGYIIRLTSQTQVAWLDGLLTALR